MSFVIGFIFIKYINWNDFEKYSYFISFFPLLLFVLYFLITEKELQPLKALKNHLLSRRKLEYNRKYNEFNFNIEEYNKLENEISEYNNE